MEKVFAFFDANQSGKVSRAEFAMGCELMSCPLSPAAVEVIWQMNGAMKKGNEPIEYDEFAAIFKADYRGYFTNGEKVLQTGRLAKSI